MSHSYRDFLTEERSGVLCFGGARMALLDIEAGFWGLRRQMEALAGERLTDSVLQQAGANGGASFAASFIDQTSAADTAQALRDCVAAYQAAGFGKFEIEAMEWPLGQVLIRGEDTFEAWMINQHQQAPHLPACAYTAGVLVGFVNVLAVRNDVVCIERTCQAQGADACRFELLPTAGAGDVPAVALTPDPALGRQLNLLETLFERMPMGIVILDPDLRIRRFNPTWAGFVSRYTPFPATQVVPGTHLFDLIPGNQTTLEPIFQRVLAGEIVRQEAFPLQGDDFISYWDAVITPLVEDDRVMGILHVTTDATERVQAEIALRESQRTLEQRVRQRTQEIERRQQVAEGLRDILKTLNSNRPLPDILDEITGQARRLLATEAVVIYGLESAEGPLRIEAARGLSAEYVQKVVLPLGQGALGRAIVEGRPVLVRDTRAIFTDDAHSPLRDEGLSINTALHQFLMETANLYGAVAAVPLYAKEEVYGGLVLYYPAPREFTEEEIGLATVLADHAALAIENARLRTQVEEAAVLAERQRIARELHDSVSQALYGIGLGTRTARTLLERATVEEGFRAKLTRPLDYVLSLADAGLAEMRALIFELRPDALAEQGLVAALERQAKALQARHKIPVETDFCPEPALPLIVKEALYRVAQEALNNVVKHAQATQVQVSLLAEADTVILTVQDDGLGFESQPSYPGHLGLQSMRERLAVVNGSLKIESELNRGTVIQARLPT